MKMIYLAPGLLVAAIGGVLFFALLASVGALAKSKQLGALQAIGSGAAGATKRALLLVAVGAMVLGSCGVFAGVAKSDAERGKACQRTCAERGYASGAIGPATTPDPKHPSVMCKCAGGTNASNPLEIREAELAF